MPDKFVETKIDPVGICLLCRLVGTCFPDSIHDNTTDTWHTTGTWVGIDQRGSPGIGLPTVQARCGLLDYEV